MSMQPVQGGKRVPVRVITETLSSGYDDLGLLDLGVGWSSRRDRD